MAPAGPPILEAVAVTKRYPLKSGALRRGAGSLTAVDRVSLAIAPGETVGLVGESGSGKTTLAKMLIGLVVPSSGEVRIAGEPLSALRGGRLLAARRAVQFVFQDPMNSLNPRLTVERTLAEPLEIHGLATGRGRRERAIELLRMVQLPEAHLTRLPRELSGGERQRVGIARALAVGPQALICDEPIASLDVSVGAAILELLASLCRSRRMALLFISHDLRAVAAVCGRIAVMRGGALLEDAPAGRLFAAPADPYTELLIRSAELDLDTPARA